MTDTIQCPAILSFKDDLHPMIWGGDAISRYKGIHCDRDDIGESWEVSAVPGKESVVADGPLAGETLTGLCSRYGAALTGTRVAREHGTLFPLLVKFIDARRDLSIQVHPDDRLAAERHHSPGKTEMWYVIDTRPGASILVGLDRQLDPDSYTRAVADNTITDAIARYDSHPGDSFYIPAGRVHAIGAGNLLAEIQQTSDITYRIYDYNRLGSDGKPRQLHTAEARDAIDYTLHPEGYRNTPVTLPDGTERVVRCSHFTVDRITVDGSRTLPADPESFTILICLDGELTVCAGGDTARLTAGHTLLLAASAGAATLRGHATLLTAKA